MDISTSVIMPVRNGAAFIAEGMRSALVQLDPNDELLVVDDGSTDDTCSIVIALGDPRVHLMSSPRRGASAARNVALASAGGEFIAFLDHDDLWPAGRHRPMFRKLAENPGIDAVFGRLRVRFEPGVKPTPAYLALDGQFLPQGHLSSGLIRHAAVRRIGGFAEDMSSGEDLDFHSRLIEAGIKIELVDVDGLIYRRHGTNMTNDPRMIESGVLLMLRRKLARARSRREDDNDVT